MTTINLLPWREQAREDSKKHFLVALASSGVSALVLAIVAHFMMSSWIGAQQARNNLIEVELARYNQQIQEIAELKKLRADLIARMRIIQLLQSNRPQVVHLFEEIIKMLPQGVYLTRLDRVNNRVTIRGLAESNTNVSALMRFIENSDWLQDPELSRIKKITRNGQAVNDFRLNANVKIHTDEQGEG